MVEPTSYEKEVQKAKDRRSDWHGPDKPHEWSDWQDKVLRLMLEQKKHSGLVLARLGERE